ncbi:MAG: polysaccharide biosynthesis tyrosine autokinase [Gemmatimonadota bacterium]
MTTDPGLRPFGEPESEGAAGPAPHLSDYWQVLTRRMWLIILIFGITTTAVIWAVSQQRIYYQSFLSLQVNDPLERSRSINPAARITGMNIFVDPIQSEMEVLRSNTIAGKVVDSLGLRFTPTDPLRVRSDLFRNVHVDADMPEGRYELAYDDDGTTVRLRATNGEVLGQASVGGMLDAGGLRFTPRPPPGEELVYPVAVVSRAELIPQIRGGLAPQPRESTNIIDVSFTWEDPVLTPDVLNVAAWGLRDYGAERVRMVGAREVEFIEDRLDSARVQLTSSLQQIRAFKESAAFTNLSAQEQQVIIQTQELGDAIRTLQGHHSILAQTVRRSDRETLSENDLINLRAELPQGSYPQLQELVQELQASQQELRALIRTRGLNPDHPDARAIEARIAEQHLALAEALRANLRVVEDRLEDLDQQLAQSQARQREFPGLENQLQTLEVQQTTDLGTYQFLLGQLQQARITEAAAQPYVDIIDPAIGVSPIQPRGRINIILGAFLGLILGVGAAFFLEYLDRTLRTSSDVETLLSIPVLGVIPRLRRLTEEETDSPQERGRRDLPMIVALDPLDPAAEAYRNLRMNLMFMSTRENPIRSIVFSSPGPNEGKSTTAVNFAVMLAQQGQKVLLVDADLRRPALHRALDILREPGLSNLLVGDVELRDAIRPNVLPNLDFMPAGPFPPNPSELLNSRAMVRLLEEMEGKYSHVVIDSPPVLAVTDAALLASHTDGLVVVLRSGATEQRAAERAVDQLRRIGVRVFGAVLNEVAAVTTDDSYYLQYYYSYQPHQKKGWSRVREGLSKARFW